MLSRSHFHRSILKGDASGSNRRDFTIASVKHKYRRCRECKCEFGVEIDSLSFLETLKCGLITESLGEDVGVCHVCRHFEGFAQGGFEHLWRSSRIAQCEGGFGTIPRSPTIDFRFRTRPRISAYPVSIGQHIGIVFLPLQALSEVAP